ncbi:MAG: hypothetical protein RSD29_03755 [Bacilli bacterium]
MEKKKVNKKRVKERKYYSDEQKEVFRFIAILVGIVLIVLVVYFISNRTLEPKKEEETTITEGTVDYDLVSVGTMFNRPNKEYYVAIYDKKDNAAVLYSTLINKYSENKDALKIYFCNLADSFNEEYFVGENGVTNKDAKTIEDLKLGKFTFVKIKKGKIVKYLEDLEAVKKELSI